MDCLTLLVSQTQIGTPAHELNNVNFLGLTEHPVASCFDKGVDQGQLGLRGVEVCFKTNFMDENDCDQVV